MDHCLKCVPVVCVCVCVCVFVCECVCVCVCVFLIVALVQTIRPSFPSGMGLCGGGEGGLSLAYASSGSERNAISELFPNFLDPA